MGKKIVMPGELKGLLADVTHNENAEIDKKQTERKEQGVEKKVNIKKETVPKKTDDSSIGRIIAYAQEYKDSEKEMRPVVLTEDVKQMIDKLKIALPEKVSIKYLLSAIVKEYMESHKDEINHLFINF